MANVQREAERSAQKSCGVNAHRVVALLLLSTAMMLVMILAVQVSSGRGIVTIPSVRTASAQGSGLQDPVARLQREVKRRFLLLQEAIGSLLSGSKGDDTGYRLTMALKRSREFLLVERLGVVQRLLQRRQLEEAFDAEIVLEKDLTRILRVLRGEDEATELGANKEELERLREELERLERLTKEQEKNSEETAKQAEEKKPSGSSGLSRKQNELQREAKEMEKRLERKWAKREERRQSLGRSGGQSPKGPQSRSQQSLKQASKKMEGATNRMRTGNLRGAKKDQDEALAQLRRAREELREELKKAEEEQREDVISIVLLKLNAVLGLQEVLTIETSELDVELRNARATQTPAEESVIERLPAEFQRRARAIARRERLAKLDVDDVVRVVEAGETSVVAPRILARVQEDLGEIAGLLSDGLTSELTQLLQQDVETTLRSVLKAFDRDRKLSKGGGGGGGGKPKPEILPRSSEVRMILEEQRRLRQRTQGLAKIQKQSRKTVVSDATEDGNVPEEGPSDSNLLRQAARLAASEQSLAEFAEAFLAKYPRVDPFLLGTLSETVGERRQRDATDSRPIEIKESSSSDEDESTEKETTP